SGRITGGAGYFPIAVLAADLFRTAAANILDRYVIFKIGAELLFNPEQCFVAVLPVLDHIACNGQKVHLPIAEIGKFEREELIENSLTVVFAAPLCSALGTTINHDVLQSSTA